MLKQLEETDVAEIEFAIQILDMIVKNAKAGKLEKASEQFSGIRIKMSTSPLWAIWLQEDHNAKDAKLPPKRPGIQKVDTSTLAFPEPPKDGGALGHIPEAILKADKQIKDIDSHVMEHWDR